MSWLSSEQNSGCELLLKNPDIFIHKIRVARSLSSHAKCFFPLVVLKNSHHGKKMWSSSTLNTMMTFSKIKNEKQQNTNEITIFLHFLLSQKKKNCERKN